MNGIIVINKPEGWTSHDVVGKLRGILHEKRIGHGGTLDPMATGVLPVFVGRATRAVEFCEADEKEYIAGMKLGVVTDTQDTTGTVLNTYPVNVTADDVAAAIPEFLGEQEQIPPMYSAIKVNGQKLYELARKGIEIERKARHITIKKLELSGGSDGEYSLRVVCSKGTYIRSLVNDIGDRLGCGAAMSSLVRARSGVFTLEDAVTIDEVSAAMSSGQAETFLRPTDSLFSDYPEYIIRSRQERLCRNGNPFSVSADNGRYRVYNENGNFLMIGDASEGMMRTVKSFFEVE